MRALVSKYQLMAFFILAYAISWILWIPFLLFPGGLLEILGILGAFGPALACIIVSAVVDPKHTMNRRVARRITFALVWLAASAAFTLYITWGAPSDNMPAVTLISVALGLVPAFVASSAFSRVTGIRSSLSRLVRPPGGLGWHVIAVLLVPAMLLLGAAITRLLGRSVSYPPRGDNTLRLVTGIAISFLYAFFYAGGMNEESGWRGFALPRLQARLSPLLASVVLGIIWLLWHLPLDLAGRRFGVAGFRIYTSAVVGGFIFTWLYNRSGGSLLAAVLLHSAANVAFELLPMAKAWDYVQIVVAIAMILVDRMWRRLPLNSPGVAGRPNS
ncbi:MAG: CPBP family intramembrane metalloprotease [Anaerolineae bacterium]|nr:CPBP family intramembrane metalloprotease [Anaerolineae bacterium]